MFDFLRGRHAADRRLMEGAFAAAEESDDPTVAMLLLLGACASPDAAVAGRAGRELASRLGKVPIDALPQLDDRVRRRLSYGWHWSALPGWILERDAVSRVRLRGAAALPALALLSMHPNGHVREDAVAALAAASQGGAELPYLLLRANDWVEPIRLRVWHALHARFAPRLAGAWVAALPLAMRLLDARRDDHSLLVARIREQLASRPECRPALMAGLASPDRVVRRASFGILAESLNPGDAVRIGLANGDPVVRLQAARAAARLAPGEFAAIVPLMLLDRFAAVRTVAAIFAARAGDVGLLRAAALDASATPRAIAAAGLVKRGVDVAALYRAAVDGDEATRGGAVAGLGERGAADDAETVVRFLEDPRAKVREAAVEAFTRLAPAEAAPVLARMMEDAVPSVSRAAMRAMERRRTWIDPAVLEGLYASSHLPHVRTNALRLMSQRGRWTGIIPILRGLCDGEEAVARAARGHLTRWTQLQRGGHVPASAAEHEAFLAALDQYGGCLADPELAARLRTF